MGLDLFEKEQDDLLADLVDIPKKACDRRVRPYSSVKFGYLCPRNVCFVV